MIEIFQNVLTENHREEIYMHAINANYKIGWGDTSTFEYRQYPCLHSDISRPDWRQLDFVEGIQNEPMKDLVKDLQFDKAVIKILNCPFYAPHGKNCSRRQQLLC